MRKDKYEISLWEDYLEDGYYKERKLAIIGSNTMTASWRAVEPLLKQNINGTNTFTFKMYYSYIDTETGLKETNPMIKLLVNERKVKVHWKNKWYDLVIKSCQEDSNGKSITYTCKDQFINELSKTGFELEFSNELMNNQGTINQLAGRVLEGTDWQVGESDVIYQFEEEPVYEVILTSPITAKRRGKEEETISAGSTILVYYSTFINKDTQFWFHYASTYTTEDNRMLVNNGDSYVVSATWENNQAKIGSLIIDFANRQVSSNYRAKRIIRKQLSLFDANIERYVKVFKDSNGKTVYGYEKSVFNSPTAVVNILTNSSNFKDTTGWIGEDGAILTAELYPKAIGGVSYLHLHAGTYTNTGIRDGIQYLPEGFQSGEKYILRYQVGTLNGDQIVPSTQKLITPIISGDIFNISSGFVVNEEWVEIECECIKSITKDNILSQGIGLSLVSAQECYLREVQFFKYAEGANGRLNPNEIASAGIGKIEYRYYEPQIVQNKEDIIYLYVGEKELTSYTPVYEDKEKGYEEFEKIRSIEASKSNRFNILQSLAETFECYPKFDIQHNEETGELIYINGIPQKFVSFHEEIGKRTGLGFIYGIDLKTISRTINSDQIVSKTIVSPNSNEYGINGFCSIARAEDNLSKSNFILNFDYYISQGLLQSGEVNGDLYDTSGESIGYYQNLRQLNLNYDSSAEQLSTLKTELLKQQSFLSTYQTYESSIKQQMTALQSDMLQLAGNPSGEFPDNIEAYLQTNSDNETVKSLLLTYNNLKNTLEIYDNQINDLKTSTSDLINQIEDLEKAQETYIEEIKELDARFYKKYSRFIQEGSWISENYIDDNLYYLDAKSVAYTSSRPQVQYNISVLRLSALEEFKHKVFNLGDIGYIQDTEFFGYVAGEVVTPYKEEVLISEITSYFDSPEKDSFKVQNYKTQFEDLFQRITATTQSLQYSQGEYQKVANIIESDGSIKASILQNTLSLNENIMISSQNNNITKDATGITLVDASDPAKKVKLTSAGIIFTNDGVNWKTGIDANGVRSDYLTAGAINTNDITIFSGTYPTFRWTAEGINAYAWTEEYGVLFNKFVRFDQFGVYGINNVSTENNKIWTPQGDTLDAKEKDIWDTANFGLTWNGFFIKNRENDGWVEISSEEDIAVFKGTSEDAVEKIKIGRLRKAGDKTIYGIKIADDDGNAILVTEDNGELWLKNKIQIGTNDTSTVKIGYLDEVRENTDVHEVIHAGDGDTKFVVYEDGRMEAEGATFRGEIYATSGQIGNMTIGDVENVISSSKKLDIQSKMGYTFKVGVNGTATPSSLLLEAKTTGFEIKEEDIDNLNWSGSSDFETWTDLGTTGLTYSANYSQLKNSFIDGVYFIKVQYGDSVYEDYCTLTYVKDGEDGEEPVVLVITSSNGNYFRNNIGSTVLTARLYQGGREIDDALPYDYNYEWEDTNGNPVGNTKSITVNANDVNFNRTYICNVSKGGN